MLLKKIDELLKILTKIGGRLPLIEGMLCLPLKVSMKCTFL